MVEVKTYSDGEILQTIKEIVGKVVLMEPDEISDEASLVDDIGMESIDFLDVAFRLEETFGISLPRQGFIERFVDKLGPDALVSDGKISSQGVTLLRIGFPEVTASSNTTMLSGRSSDRIWPMSAGDSRSPVGSSSGAQAAADHSS